MWAKEKNGVQRRTDMKGKKCDKTEEVKNLREDVVEIRQAKVRWKGGKKG